MFVWKVSKILEDFKRYLPKVYDKLEKIAEHMGTDKEAASYKRYLPYYTFYIYRLWCYGKK